MIVTKKRNLSERNATNILYCIVKTILYEIAVAYLVQVMKKENKRPKRRNQDKPPNMI